MVKGRIHSIETFGSVDGPGIRFVIFTQGCGMRCKYCHNVDTWKCGGGQEKIADELLDQAQRYQSYWGKDGGITVSGGEALLQIDFLADLMHKAKARGINTCLDTSGHPFTRQEPFFSKFQALMKDTDLLLVDIKHIDAIKHKYLTGRDNENILDMLHYLSEIGKPVWIRHVLVPGITDSDEDLQRTADFIKTLTNVERIDVLPYHALGCHKWEALGIPYTLGEVASPSPERVENAMRILTGKNQKV